MGKAIIGDATTKKYDPCKSRPYNRYNIYYILERERFLQSRPKYKSAVDKDTCCVDIITGYEHLGDLPPVPLCYANVRLSPDWYMPGKRKVKKRNHTKSHGVASFQEIARVVADGWKAIDDVTLDYCTAMAEILKKRHNELKKSGGLIPSLKLDFSKRAKSKPCHSLNQTWSNKLHAVAGLDEIPPAPRSSHLKGPFYSQGGDSLNELCDNDALEVIPSSLSIRRLETSVHSEISVHAQVDISDVDIIARWPVHSEISVHAQVDISDIDIIAMWHRN